MRKEDIEALEALVDRHGLYDVVDALTAVCDAKAVHLAENWQDKHSSDNWAKAVKVFTAAHDKLKKIQERAFK